MEYSFRAKVWKYQGPAGWYFVTLPKLLSKKIRRLHGPAEEGWGRLKTIAKVGKSKWDTSIWHDSRAEGYILPIKAMIRKAESVKVDSRIVVVLELQPIDPKVLKWLRP